MSEHPPFFVVGSARSGTTLLRLMLNAHSQVAVPPESRFIIELWRDGDVVVDGFLRALDRHDRFRLWDLPLEAIRAEVGGAERLPFRSMIEAVYDAWTRVHGKTRWGDKTPRYVTHMDRLARLFPEARFVHLIRDGRNVALSYADTPFGPKTVPKAAALWGRRVRAGIASGRAMPAGRYLEMRYEDLVEDPGGELKTLCGFLGLSFEPEMLDHTEHARGEVLVDRAAHFNPHVTEPPTAGVRSWQTQMSGRDAEIFEAIAGDVLVELAYERRSPTPGARARIAARLGVWGAPVATLRKYARRK